MSTVITHSSASGGTTTPLLFGAAGAAADAGAAVSAMSDGVMPVGAQCRCEPSLEMNAPQRHPANSNRTRTRSHSRARKLRQ
jgi:hypothetical protein